MILPLRVLGRASVKRISSGRAREPISLETHLRSSSFSSSTGLVAALERDEGGDGLALEVVGAADDGGFGDLGMGDERRLDFHGAEAVAADVDDVVDAAHEPEVAVGVHARAVAGEVAAGDVGPIGLAVALGIAVDGAGHGGPGLADDEQAAVAGGDGVEVALASGCVTTSGWMPKKGRVAEPGLVGDGAGDGRDHDGAGLGLPPGVDDGAAVVADLLAVPHPGFGVDGLADCAEEAKRVELVLFDVLVAPLDEGANGGGRGVEDGDLWSSMIFQKREKSGQLGAPSYMSTVAPFCSGP